MILQPFVENAIWHGFNGKKGSGYLSVSFRQKEGKLVCSVVDNGVGRGTSIRQEHESKALEITRQRLNLIAKNRPTGQTGLEIIDLKDTQGNAAGTQVIVQLPTDL